MRALELKIPPVVQFALAAAAMGLFAWCFPAAAIRFGGQLLAASTMLLAAGLVGLAGVRAFARAATSVNPLQPDQATQLVRHGVYKFSRNPMYLALLMALAAWGLWLGNAVSLVVLPVFVVAIERLQIRPEERTLARLFGAQYLEYCRSTRRWI